MDLKVASVIVCLCALAITSTEAGIPKCCISVTRTISRRVLQNVQRWEMQKSNGACDITALKLYVKDRSKPICAHPKVKTYLLLIQKQIKLNKPRAKY